MRPLTVITGILLWLPGIAFYSFTITGKVRY